MNCKQLVSWISLACLATLTVEAVNPRPANAQRVPSLYAGQSEWVSWDLTPGEYILEAQTVLNLGDVDVAIHDPTGRRFAQGTVFGGEVIAFTVNPGGQGTYRVRYSMPMCVNPLGACAVTINLRRQ
ncbi:MAG: hypothetical protein HC895_25500 [Leptolyngbyaceae cyanobacterium SM1_3_5]|nr:hypothetical protein [Leptolyngbyaceae cyanobacterium SM1_3_5]